MVLGKFILIFCLASWVRLGHSTRTRFYLDMLTRRILPYTVLRKVLPCALSKGDVEEIYFNFLFGFLCSTGTFSSDKILSRYAHPADIAEHGNTG